MGQNEFKTLLTLSILQQEVTTPEVTKYNGRVIRLMDDGSLLAFNSASNAIAFAVDVQRIMAEGKTAAPLGTPNDLKMGARLGNVILTENEFHGEGINVAVWLEQIAPPAGICIWLSIYTQTKTAPGEDLPAIAEQQLKNIADPVSAWRWLRPGTEAEVAPVRATGAMHQRLHGPCQ